MISDLEFLHLSTLLLNLSESPARNYADVYSCILDEELPRYAWIGRNLVIAIVRAFRVHVTSLKLVPVGISEEPQSLHCPVPPFLHGQHREGVAGLRSQTNAEVFIVWGSRVCPPKYAFWDLDYFKLVVVRKHKTQEEPLTSPLTV